MVIDETPQDPTGNCEIFMYEDNFCGNLREIFLTPNDEGVCHIFTATGNLAAGVGSFLAQCIPLGKRELDGSSSEVTKNDTDVALDKRQFLSLVNGDTLQVATSFFTFTYTVQGFTITGAGPILAAAGQAAVTAAAGAIASQNFNILAGDGSIPLTGISNSAEIAGAIITGSIFAGKDGSPANDVSKALLTALFQRAFFTALAAGGTGFRFNIVASGVDLVYNFVGTTLLD